MGPLTLPAGHGLGDQTVANQRFVWRRLFWKKLGAILFVRPVV